MQVHPGTWQPRGFNPFLGGGRLRSGIEEFVAVAMAMLFALFTLSQKYIRSERREMAARFFLRFDDHGSSAIHFYINYRNIQPINCS